MLGCNISDTPILYQDLADSTMAPFNFANSGMMNAMYGTMGGTSFLGGVQMRRQPDSDKVEIMNKKQQETKNTAKKLAIGLGGLFALFFVPQLYKSIKKAGGIINYTKKLFKIKTKTTAP